MSIREVSDATVDQECASCGHVRKLTYDHLAVGVARAGGMDSRTVRLPPCPTCGAVEFLVRSPDGEEHPSPGSYGHLHRLLVDTLHAKLVHAGRLAKGLDAKTVGVKEPTADEVARWLKSGLRLERPSRTDGK